MNIALWIIAGALALAFLAAGSTKLLKGRDGLAEDPRMAWSQDFSPGGVRAIGAVEVLGAIGLILPALTGVATILVPLAAAGLALTMVGAIIVHVRRDERQAIAAPLVFAVLALVVAWGRYGPFAI